MPASSSAGEGANMILTCIKHYKFLDL
jgi:predicted O-methyltransferase YrrM